MKLFELYSKRPRNKIQEQLASIAKFSKILESGVLKENLESMQEKFNEKLRTIKQLLADNSLMADPRTKESVTRAHKNLIRAGNEAGLDTTPTLKPEQGAGQHDISHMFNA